MQDFLTRAFMGNPVTQWAYALGVTVATMLVLRVFLSVSIRRIERLAKKTETHLDDLAAELLGKTKLLLIFLVAIWAGSRLLVRGETLDTVFNSVFVIGMLLQVGFWGMGVINYTMARQLRLQKDEDPGLATALGVVGFVARLLLWAVVVLTVMGSLGVEITAFVASLGIGGIAIALALQTVLGDLVASLSIILDKPFLVGDYIEMGESQGTVQHVGLKTTRLKALGGEQLILSNSDLLSHRIHNYGRMGERRVGFKIGVPYSTDPARLREIPSIIQVAIEAHPNTRFDRSHLTGFGDSSLDFSTVYYMTVPDYAAHMNTRQEVHFQILDEFKRRGIRFAFPTRMIHYVDESKPEGELGGAGE